VMDADFCNVAADASFAMMALDEIEDVPDSFSDPSFDVFKNDAIDGADLLLSRLEISRRKAPAAVRHRWVRAHWGVPRAGRLGYDIGPRGVAAQ